MHETEQRTFTSSDGRKVDAKLDHYNPSDNMVTLRLSNSNKAQLTLDRFSPADQKYILDWRSDYDASFVRVNFFGNRIEGGRIIFMLDSSGSMTGDQRWEKLVRNMTAILKQLKPGAEFNIIHFGSSAHAFKRDLAIADKKVIQEAINWLEETTPSGGTNLAAAIKAAAPMKKASVYAILSDGYPSNADSIRPAIRSNQANNGTQIDVYTVSYYTRGEGADFLRDLAKDFSGNYVKR